MYTGQFFITEMWKSWKYNIYKISINFVRCITVKDLCIISLIEQLNIFLLHVISFIILALKTNILC